MILLKAVTMVELRRGRIPSQCTANVHGYRLHEELLRATEDLIQVFLS